MKKVYSLLVLLLSFFINATAQTSLKGIVKDNNAPASFINVVLLNTGDSSLVKGTLTGENGNYSFDNIPQGNYLVLSAQIGNTKYYSPKIEVSGTTSVVEVPAIEMKGSAVELKEANIVSTKPFIEHRIDKTVVNVENSIVNAGATAIEVLKQSPGITVDNDGNISMQGKQDVLVMIDGKPTYLSTQDLNTMLRNMSSADLAQIEIITNPSSKYDAAGNSGVLNLKLKKKPNLGMNGSVRLSYGQGAYPDIGIGLSLNYRNERLNLFGSYDYTNGYYYESSHLDRRFDLESGASVFKLKTFDKGKYINNNFRGGMDYFLNKNNTIGILVKGSLNTNNDRTAGTTDIFNAGSAVDSGYTNINESESRWNNVSGNINYKYVIDTLGAELTVDADYAQYDNRADFDFTTDHYDYTGTSDPYTEITTAKQPAKIDIRSGKIDYSKPFNYIYKMEAGLKTSFVTTDNDVKYYNYYDNVSEIDTGKTNHFKYTENINAAYINGTAEYKKVGVQLGLRAEQTVAEGQLFTKSKSFKNDYLDLFPSAFLTYKFNENHQSKLSYSRRIDRPGYQQLNPFKYFIDPYNYQQGNESLKPQFTHSFEVMHTFKGSYSLSVRYSCTTDAMTQVGIQNEDTRTTYITTQNLATRENISASLNLPINISNWWQSSNNATVFNNKIKGVISSDNNSADYDIQKDITTLIFNSYNSFVLPKGWGAELSGNYFSKMYWGTMLVNPRFSINAGVRKSFFRDRLTVRVNLNDIFHTDVTDSKIQYGNINVDFHSIYDSQFFRVHAMYNFGKKTVARARQRSTAAEDEENRINTGR